LLIAGIIFAESGMFVGFFFPGDTLLISAGVFAAAGKMNLATLIPIVAIAAIAGDNVGYHIGKRYGRSLFRKPDGLFFRHEYVERSEKFYNKYGSKTMLLAHFVPIVRTFAPSVAGVAKMDYKQFFIYDAIGDIAWAIIVIMLGYWFGSKIPNLDHYILLIVVAAVLITLGPTLYHVAKSILQNRKKRASSNNPNQDK